MNDENREKGARAEALFAKYLDDQKIPYYHIDQDRETYSDEFYKKNIRRPDYIIHTEKGLFHIDVKYRTKMNFGKKGEKRFYLNQDEIITLCNFQNRLHTYVWLSFTADPEKLQFHYAPISEIHEYHKNILDFAGEDFAGKTAYDECWIYIPEKLLYNQLSFEKGFYREPDRDFFEKEMEYHKTKWKFQQKDHPPVYRRST
ncbi:MAG: NERD domain-containing protein [Treponema sp.]|nr:NERD domain-containing protein [Treponema sp.]